MNWQKCRLPKMHLDGNIFKALTHICVFVIVTVVTFTSCGFYGNSIAE